MQNGRTSSNQQAPVASTTTTRAGVAQRRFRLQDDEDEHDDDVLGQRIHDTVSLPPLPRSRGGNGSSSGSDRRRPPGVAVRSSGSRSRTAPFPSDTPPIPPPRPESTLSPHTRDLPRPSSSSSPSSPSNRGRGLSTPPSALPSSPVVLLGNDISLTAPRPDQQRSQNLYVDAPLQNLPTGAVGPLTPVHRTTTSPAVISKEPLGGRNVGRGAAGALLPHSSKNQHLRCVGSGFPLPRSPPPLPPTTVIASSKKPQPPPPPPLPSAAAAVAAPSPTLKGNLSESLSPSSLGPGSNTDSVSIYSDSIICRDCGNCRCDACRTPARLPEKWLCGNKCHVSAGTAVDLLSCMCLVKAAVYHCGKDHEAKEEDNKKSGLDDPCSCSAAHCCSRWSCLAASTIVLPCLACYLPLRGCVRMAEKIYQRATFSGCECTAPPRPPMSAATAARLQRQKNKLADASSVPDDLESSTATSVTVISSQPMSSMSSTSPVSSSPPSPVTSSVSSPSFGNCEKRLLG